MKDHLPLKWQTIPRYEATSFLKTVKRSAQEHGYRSALWYGIIRLKDHLFGNWAMRWPWGGARKWLQRKRGVKIGKHVHWGTNIVVDNSYPYFVVIEDGASISGNDYFLAHSKPMEYHASCIRSYVSPIIVRKNAWLAVNVTVLPGVEIGEGAVVSAGSVVSQDIPPFTVASGNPAKMVADISKILRRNYSEEEFEQLLRQRKEKYKI